MSESIWGWWIILLGIMMLTAIMLVTDMTTTNEENYFMTKQISEAAMIEAIDYQYYKKYGELRISSEKYMENFIRRYAEVITINKTTTINFYDIYEVPPKVTVEIATRSSQLLTLDTNITDVSVRNRLNAILEMVEK